LICYNAAFERPGAVTVLGGGGGIRLGEELSMEAAMSFFFILNLSEK